MAQPVGWDQDLNETRWAYAALARAHAALAGACSVLAFALFLLANAALFLRPSDLVPGAARFRLYENSVLACLALAAWPVLRQLTPRALARAPITVCVLGLLVAVALSHGLDWDTGRASLVIFAKLLAYYLLLVAVVNSPGRLRLFLVWMAVCVTVLTLLALLEYRGVINIPDLAPLEGSQRRLQSVGIFHNPNDVALILVPNMCVCVYFLESHSWRRFRFLWVVPLALFGYALALTFSRGGSVALMGACLTLLGIRFGWRKALVLAACFLPALVFVYSGRWTGMRLVHEEERIGLWVAGLRLFARQPLFGSGAGNYLDHVIKVAHNSFIHCYAEMGFVGGTFFLGAFYMALAGFYDLGPGRSEPADPRLRRLHPYLAALVVSYGLGILFLSRQDSPTTYLVLGLATVYFRLAASRRGLPSLQLNGRLALRVCLASVAFLVAMFLMTFLLGGFERPDGRRALGVQDCQPGATFTARVPPGPRELTHADRRPQSRFGPSLPQVA